jgi:hypothetical protein
MISEQPGRFEKRDKFGVPGQDSKLAVETGDLHAVDVGFENFTLRSHNLQVNSVGH